MPLFKATRHPTILGIALILFLCFLMTPREAATQHQRLEEDKELFNKHDYKAGYPQYRAGERVASDVYVNWERLVPETEITSHVPGFTVLRSLMVANGTFFVVSDRPNQLPGLQFVLSAWNDANGERPSSSMPSQNEIRVISRKTVAQLMGTSASLVAGTTWIYNEPYVYVDGSWPLAFLRAHYMQDHRSTNNYILLPPTRVVFSQIPSEKVRHNPALWSLPHLLFPGSGVLYTEDWKDYTDSRRPFLLENVVLVDRGAAARNPRVQNSSGRGGERIDDKTERLNLELGTPFDSFRDVGGLWWNRWRHLLAENMNLEADIEGPKTGKTVITLVQDHNGQRGRLAPDSDAKLRAELVAMKLDGDYEINYVNWNETDFMDRLDLALQTTIFLGVVGSLTEAMWMTVAPHSAVMEFFPDHYLSRRTQGISKAIGVQYTAWQGTKSYHLNSLELPSKGSGIQNPHLTPHEHETRGFIEPREDDLIHIDGKAVVNAIREWVREHQIVDKNSS